MLVRPFTLLGNTTLDAVRGVARDAVQDWADAWGIAPSAFSVECRRGQEAAPAEAKCRRAWRQQDRSMWLAWAPEFANEVQRAVFIPDAGYASHASKPACLAPLGSEVALEQLAAALVAAMAPGAEAVQDAPGATEFASGSGSLQLQLRIGKQTCHALLNGHAVGALATPGAVGGFAAQQPKLAPLDYQAVLQDIAVALPVHIGTATVGLGSLMSAGIGDVVRLDTSVDEPVAVAGPDGVFLFDAYLGRLHDVVAVEIAARY